MKYGISLGLAGAVAFALVSIAPVWADGSEEAAVAATHAGMAAGSNDIKMVQMHLHHVVNCIVGEKGEGYDAAAGNPCKGKGPGMGAMNDPKNAMAKEKLDMALKTAMEGIKTTDADAARAAAKKAQDILAHL